jgi:hypothetical protein
VHIQAEESNASSIKLCQLIMYRFAEALSAKLSAFLLKLKGMKMIHLGTTFQKLNYSFKKFGTWRQRMDDSDFVFIMLYYDKWYSR